jgi:hypothetical protein
MSWCQRFLLAGGPERIDDGHWDPLGNQSGGQVPPRVSRGFQHHELDRPQTVELRIKSGVSEVVCGEAERFAQRRPELGAMDEERIGAHRRRRKAMLHHLVHPN